MVHLFSVLRKLFTAFIVICVTFVVLSILFRLSGPLFNLFRVDVETIASHFAKRAITIGEVQTSWRGLQPVILFNDVVVYQDPKTHTVIKFKRMGLGIDILASAYRHELVLGQLMVSGADFIVRQDTVDDPTLNALEAWLLLQPKILIKNVSVEWIPKEGKPISFSNIALMLENKGERHYAEGNVIITQKSSGSAHFTVDLRGAVLGSSFEAQINLNGKNISLLPWIPYLHFDNFKLISGSVDPELQAQWKNNHWEKVQGYLKWKDLSLETLNTDQRIDTKQGESDIDIFPNGGDVTFAINNSLIHFGKLFRDAIPLDHFESTLSWEIDPQAISIHAKNIKAANIDATAQGQMNLTLLPNKAEPLIDLSVYYQLNKISHKSRYLPVSVLSPALVKWLDDAIVNGKKAQGSMVLRGDLAKFPFDDGSGLLLINAFCEGITLLYQPDWPKIDDLNAKLVFTNRRLDIESNHGQILGSQIKFVKAVIPRMDEATLTMLYIDAMTQGNAKDGVRFVKESPLKDLLGEGLKALQAQGSLQLGLKLTIPLDTNPKLKTQVVGNIELNNTTWFLPFGNTQLEQVSGKVQFTEDTLKGSNITGTFLNQPLAISLYKGIASKVTTLVFVGKMAIGNMIQKLHWHAEKYFSGTSNYRAELVLASPESNITSKLILTSDWIGTQVTLPGSFKKRANEARPLNIEVPFKPSGKTQIHLHIEKWVDGVFSLEQRSNGQVITVEMPAVAGSLTIPPSGTIRPWQISLRRLTVPESGNTPSVSINPGDLPPMNVTVDDLRYGSKRLGRVVVNASHLPDAMRINHLSIADRDYLLEADGFWRRAGEGSRTNLMGKFVSRNLAETLRLWGLPPSIESKVTHVAFSLGWADAPFSPQLSSLSGKLHFNLAQGRITDIGTGGSSLGMSLGRLLSLLSIETLPRRLKLDFSDLNPEGFSFDRMEGDFSFAKSNAFTENTHLEGPVANIKLNGRIGLTAKDYDLYLAVTSHVAQSLPIVATITGGPLVGAVAWVAERALHAVVGKITAQDYHITGSWHKPVIQKVGSNVDSKQFVR